MKNFLFLIIVLSSTCFANDPIFDEIEEENYVQKMHIDNRREFDYRADYAQWRRYKVNFGIEKIFLSFPQKPVINQSNDLLSAYTYDRTILYTFSGYFPAICNIDYKRWFAETLDTMNSYPYLCLAHKIYRNSSGDWVLDYTSHNYIQNLIVKTRAVVTPFNAYLLQCTKPINSKDAFERYLEKFAIQCECQD